MLVPRVLVRWLPSTELRNLRTTALGTKWGSEVQQLGIDGHHPSYGLAFALASRLDDGRFILDVGFKGGVYEAGGSWYLADKEQLAKGQRWGFDMLDLDADGKVESWTVDSLTPQVESLLAYELNRRSDSEQAAILTLAATTEAVYRRKADDLAREAAEARQRGLAGSPLFNVDAFASVAAVSIGGPWWRRWWALAYMRFLLWAVKVRLWWATRGREDEGKS